MKLRVALAVLLCTVTAAVASPEPPWSGGTNCSGTIATGGTAQPLTLPRALHGYQIQNESADALAFSEFTTTPATFTAGSWTLTAASGSLTTSTSGESYNSPPTYSPASPIYIIGATTGDAFTCSAW